MYLVILPCDWGSMLQEDMGRVGVRGMMGMEGLVSWV